MRRRCAWSARGALSVKLRGARGAVEAQVEALAMAADPLKTFKAIKCRGLCMGSGLRWLRHLPERVLAHGRCTGR